MHRDPNSSPLESDSRTEPGEVRAKTERLLSIDALRGFDMFWIIGGSEIARKLLESDDPNRWTHRVAEQFQHVQDPQTRAAVGAVGLSGQRCIAVRFCKHAIRARTATNRNRVRRCSDFVFALFVARATGCDRSDLAPDARHGMWHENPKACTPLAFLVSCDINAHFGRRLRHGIRNSSLRYFPILRPGANPLRRQTGDRAGAQRGCLQLCDCLKSYGSQSRNGPAKRREDMPICNARASTSEDGVAQLVFSDHKHKS